MDEIPEIKFLAGSASSPGLYCDLGKLYQPYPAAKNIPSWYKDLPKVHDGEEGPLLTVKTCPGIYDILRAGYIVPAWSDMVFRYDPDQEGTDQELKYVRAKAIQRTPDPPFHSNEQLGKCPISHGTPEPFSKFVKLVSPWYIETPKDVSVMYIQPYYRQGIDYSILPGIIDPWIDDIPNKEVNAFLELHVPKKDIWIRAGEPLFQVIPFRRENYKFTVDYLDSKEKSEKYRLLELDRQSKLPSIHENHKNLIKCRSTENKNYDTNDR